jgi:hypothetical protein
LPSKKDGTNGQAVRAGRPVTQLTSSSGAASSTAPSLEYIHDSIDSIQVKYKNRNLYLRRSAILFLLSCIQKPAFFTLPRSEQMVLLVHTHMTNSLESGPSSNSQPSAAAPRGWITLGTVAAASAIAGGLAAAWWYRNTLKKLRQADEPTANTNYGISGDDPPDGA